MELNELERISIAVGTYTNSYAHHLNANGMETPEKNKFVWRIGLDGLDDTCFEMGKTLHGMKEALEFLAEATKAANEGDEMAADFAKTLADAILHVYTNIDELLHLNDKDRGPDLLELLELDEEERETVGIGQTHRKSK